MVEQLYTRSGIGFDSHRFVGGRKLVLGGLEIPSEMGLLGHSDADVLCHALMDALLGSLALGDIGGHFPDTDPKYAGADSLQLLREVVRLISREGWQVHNVDATVVAEAPKLKPFILEMREKLAEAMGVDISWVSIKASTNEGMGAIGRKEGIAVFATATVRPLCD